ncbi:unnamed protein product [Brassicogethes aeneus]|uniref:Alpha-carbonic anhydrase domain-containing protein n=1 Tax=Brassicogethes aeneus TaxID=1431903 RepID=A0A9P0BA43_BRAAE|nr:unnamed protein product [Brassicogethes aeneus]
MEFMGAFLEWIINNYIVAMVFLVLLALYVKDIYDHSRGAESNNTACTSEYSYDILNGPNGWKNTFPQAAGCRQSPINIISYCAINIPMETVTPLIYSTDYHLPPSEMTLYNNGHNVVIYANWMYGLRPLLTGGPLKDEYSFCNITFRWGPNDDEGSEHMLDAKRFAMEMQASYVKNDCNEYVNDDAQLAAKNSALAVVSYFFMVTPMDNAYMDQIISSLLSIKYPFSSVNIEPIPLTLLAPCFSRKYLSYVGSLTYPPCTEGVKWIVQPEALTISSRQVRKFRKLFGINGPIFNNTRPVQKVNNRDILFYD